MITNPEIGKQVRLNERCACREQEWDACFHKICTIVRLYRDDNVLVQNYKHVRLAAPDQLLEIMVIQDHDRRRTWERRQRRTQDVHSAVV